MKRYRCQGIRNPKTDRIDAAIIAQYGIDYWFRPCRESDIESIRSELKLLGNQYHQRSYAGDPVCEYFLKKEPRENYIKLQCLQHTTSFSEYITREYRAY